MNTAGLTSSLYPSPMIARTFSQEVVGVGEILMQQFWFLQLYAYVCDSLVIVCRRYRPLASRFKLQVWRSNVHPRTGTGDYSPYVFFAEPFHWARLTL